MEEKMKKELGKNYDPKDIEDRLYTKWVSRHYFHAEVNPDKKPYTIVIPPPNITGQLHEERNDPAGGKKASAIYQLYVSGDSKGT